MRLSLIVWLSALSLWSGASADPPSVSATETKRAPSTFQVDWLVTSDQGAAASSPTFRLTSTSGQSIVGNRSEGLCFMASTGFWQNFSGYCCRNRRGNVNDDMLDRVDLSDLSLLIYYLVNPRCYTHLYCLEEADILPSGIPPGGNPIDLSDLSYLINYLTIPGTLNQMYLCP